MRIRIPLAGEFDVHASADIRERLLAVDGEGWRHIVVDMRDVTFIDSAGVAVLVAALRRAERRNATLTIEDPHPNVRRVLELTHLTAAFGLDSPTDQRLDPANAEGGRSSAGSDAPGSESSHPSGSGVQATHDIQVPSQR